MGRVAEGEAAPDFTLQTGAGGDAVSLRDFRGRTVVLYFYPKDDTPGCTKEACSFQEQHNDFAKLNAVVLGVSCDSPASHQRFAQKFGLAFPLLSDPEATISKAYGVYVQKSMYGRTYWGIERTTFVIDGRGRVARVFPKVRVDGHTGEVLEAVRSAPGGAMPGGMGTAPTSAGTGRRPASSRRRPSARA
ncbi:MAG: peroxiredoxin [Candidatus Omnitrophica bacterium CG11_big_fil_rev_8_21_14_0_20_63_9]|nr:MAG: peroxiredoxin [Candidatus Omnitrophica bacterium CG11_big_fil_rev_8_21_14_0_20_63_9]